jgi:hypothetical protein
VHLKKLRRVEGDANIFEVFRVKNHDFTPKNKKISNFMTRATPLDPPLLINFSYIKAASFIRTKVARENH